MLHLGARTATSTSRHRPPPLAPRSRREPPRPSRAPRPGDSRQHHLHAASPGAPPGGDGGREGGRLAAACPSPPALGLRLLLPDVNTHRRAGGGWAGPGGSAMATRPEEEARGSGAPCWRGARGWRDGAGARSAPLPRDTETPRQPNAAWHC